MAKNNFLNFEGLTQFFDNLKTYFALKNHLHDDKYDTKGAASTALTEAKSYADTNFALKSDVHDVKQLRITVPKGDISMAIGQKKKNSLRIQKKYYINSIKFIEKDREKRYNIKLETNF